MFFFAFSDFLSWLLPCWISIIYISPARDFKNTDWFSEKKLLPSNHLDSTLNMKNLNFPPFSQKSQKWVAGERNRTRVSQVAVHYAYLKTMEPRQEFCKKYENFNSKKPTFRFFVFNVESRWFEGNSFFWKIYSEFLQTLAKIIQSSETPFWNESHLVVKK